MAERRMFAKTIIDSDAFLEMPQSTQLLYFHLAMRADDDGFINKPKAVMTMTGCKEVDLNILALKKFIIPFDTGIVVIKHWKIHNYIRNDRYNETKYIEEKSQLEYDENNAYRLTDGIPLVDERLPQVRLGKDSIKDIGQIPDQAIELFNQFWTNYPRHVSKALAEKAFKKLKVTEDVLSKMLHSLEIQKQSRQWSDKQFIPHPATWLNQKRWEDETDEPQNEAKLIQTGDNSFKLE